MNDATHIIPEAVILLRSAIEPRKPLAEAIYCAGVTPEGEWVRLSPLSFHRGQSARQLKRWDHVRFAVQQSATDGRPESRVVAKQSLAIVGECPPKHRQGLLAPLLVKSLADAVVHGHTLALVEPQAAQFVVQRAAPADHAKEIAAHQKLVEAGQAESDHAPFPYRFSYKFTLQGTAAEASYQDVALNATLASLTKSYGEAQTVSRIMQLYGKTYPQQGMYFVMSRASIKAEQWVINEVITFDEVAVVPDLEYNLVC